MCDTVVITMIIVSSETLRQVSIYNYLGRVPLVIGKIHGQIHPRVNSKHSLK